MHKEFLMGNAAIALGAVASGVNVVAGYPGTPSTEVLETIAKHRPDDVYVEWSVNEKAAMELAAGARLCRCQIPCYDEAGRVKCCIRPVDESGICRYQRRYGRSRRR